MEPVSYTHLVPASCSYVSKYSSIGVWQMAAQKLGCSCQTQKPAPAAIKTTTTTPTTMGHFLVRGAGSPITTGSSAMALPYSHGSRAATFRPASRPQTTVFVMDQPQPK